MTGATFHTYIQVLCTQTLTRNVAPKLPSTAIAQVCKYMISAVLISMTSSLSLCCDIPMQW